MNDSARSTASVGELLRRKRGLIFAIPAGALAVLVLVAALNFDQGSAAKRESRINDADALLAPRTATADELRGAAGTLSEQTAIRLTDGAWVQVADETGRLAQQYSASKLEPLAAGKLRMTEPRARNFLKDGRVLTMSARSGLVHVPKRALDSGALEGDVEIRLYKPVDGREVDVLRDPASIVVSADQAQFDGTSGEVRCDKAVRIDTDAGSFAGEGLTLLLDADGEGVEQLVVDRALEPIRIDRAARAIAAKRRGAQPKAAVQANAQVDVGAGTDAIPAEPKRPDEPPRFYRLVLDGGVEVQRTRNGVDSTMRGDQLIAVFSLESEGLDQLAIVPAASVPVRPNGPQMFSSRFSSPTALAVGALAFASMQDAAVDASGAAGDSVVVRFGGRLEMTPVTDPAERLASRDDIRFDVVGPNVELLDGRSGSRITCSRLRYSVRDERVEADGRAGVPLRVVHPRMMLTGERFWASFSEGVGRLEGAGRMAFARGSGREVAWLELAPSITHDTARMLVSADPAAVALVQDPPARRGGAVDPSKVRFDPTEQELEIAWKGGVDLRFAGGGDDPRISGARFEGGVDVLGRQFEMDSQVLEVAFSPKNAERIEAIIAEGATTVRQIGGAGAMSADRLELFLVENKKGDSVPSRLVASKGVEAHDAKQTIWTEALVVTFAERAGNSEKKDAAPAAGSPTELGEIDVDSVEATGGVQVLLAGGRGDGARVFADELAGNARERKLRLTGENVAIVRSNIIADNLRDLRFDEASRSARSEGPGRFRAFKKPIALGAGRIERPSPDIAAALDASWTGLLDYREQSAAKGSLDIRGDVKLRSHPTELASDAVDANSIVLDLGLAHGAGDDAKVAADAERALEHFLARGDARIESRAWKDAAHTGEPRVFRVTGDHIEYDMKTREGLVVGAGGLLVNLPDGGTAGAKSTPAPGSGATPIALGSEGTTRFTWKQRMAIERVVDDRYKVRMDDGVELLHAGAREADRMSMRCTALEATVRRPDAGTGAKDGVDLGGPAELLGVRGTGDVFIRTPTQDLECGEFDYSVQSGIATLRGREGRPVTVVLANNPTPLQAQEIAWDMREGRIEIKKPLVSGGR